LLGAAPVRAADPAQGAGAYRIGIGDVLDVTIWREPDLSGRYTIDASGSLPHVLAGPVPAKGATLVELRSRLVEQLERDYLREARIGVSLVESARRKASILGAVSSPGLYALGEEMRVLELIFAAGGVTDRAADSAMLMRFDPPSPGQVGPAGARPRVRIHVDLEALLERGDLTQNPIVTPGDVLVVSSAPGGVGAPPPADEAGRVRVVGEVERPGSYSLGEAPTVLDALLAAGGLSEYASANRARLVRGQGEQRSETRLRLKDVMHGNAGAENLELRDGDLIVVPESFF